MTSVDLRSQDGATVRALELDPSLFGVEPNVAVMHQVVTAQLAAARAGTHSTLTRAEVRGGGRKPWRQKGTGRARQGSTRAPHWSGGGVAAGPKPRDYRQRTPKKMVQLALRSALSDRASEARVAVVDRWSFAAPRTKDARAALDALGLEGKVLLVLGPEDEVAYRSFRNLPDIQLMLVGELNAYDVLCNDWIVFTEATLPPGETGSGGVPAGPEPSPAKAGAPAPVASAAPAPAPPQPEPSPTPPGISPAAGEPGEHDEQDEQDEPGAGA
jgi:large subunit ribosomal protein L4